MVISDDAFGSRASNVSGNTLDEDVGLELIEVKTSILVKYMLELGENLKGIAQLSINVAVVGISERAGKVAPVPQCEQADARACGGPYAG